MAGFAMLGLLGFTSNASALILSGGPTYTLPGGGGCVVTGIPSQAGGATLTCTGLNLAAHTKVYFGIRNDSNVNGNTMTGTAPAASGAEVFRLSSTTSDSIIYTSSTTITDVFTGLAPVSNRMVLKLLSGSASVQLTGGTPANNANGDIGAVFQITGGTSFSVRVDVEASDAAHFPQGYACPTVYDPTSTPASGTSDFSKVDVAFYFSDCGDGVVDSPEACDAGGANGTTGSCCTASCTIRASGQICRPGAGGPCDLTETCTGLSPSCPPDDAPINFGMVCRSGSGDSCDLNETCTGVPGQGCPADDAPSNVGVVCRAGTVGDVCDESETCTGVPGATCPPDDAPGKINLVCRAGSGDICDPDEKCLGIPGQGCPQDIVANPSTVCRTGSGDMCDPSETCTAIPGQPCPANVVTPSGTECRASAGQCDVAEQCTGNAGQTCPTNGFASASTPCDADSSVCTVDMCNGSGSCTFSSNLNCSDGNSCTQDSCDPQDGCVFTGAPSNTCVSGVKTSLKIKNLADNSKDSVKFFWKGGPALIPNMGDPTSTTRYELCVYDGNGVQMAMGVPPGPGWSLVGTPSSPKGYKFMDTAAANDGLRLIKLQASNLPKGKAKVLGKGGQLPDTATMPFQFPVRAQLYASGGMCWDAQFDMADTKKNDGTGFSAKSAAP